MKKINRMKRLLKTLLFTLLFSNFFAQTPTEPTEDLLQKSDYETHLRYIASDELEGRRTGSQGGQKAAEYLAAQFEKFGVKPYSEEHGYMQNIPFNTILPPEKAVLSVGDTSFQNGENMILLKGGETSISAEAVFAGHGWVDEEKGIDDYAELDVKGKVVFVTSGVPNSKSPREAFMALGKKRKLAKEKGAVGLIELFRMNFPWRFFRANLGGERLELVRDIEEDENEESTFFHGFIQESVPNPISDLEKGKALSIKFESTGLKEERVISPNVIGLITGTDDSLKNEYVLISAHYDHVGVGKQGGAPFTEQDSIFNGTRDNGMGTVALLAAAQSLAANPPKRSVILLACTAEEIGLVGSQYYVDNPVFPLVKTVFNLNNDGAGYNSVEHFTVIGLEMTNVDELLEKAGNEYGLSVTGDPAPGQNLYQRSDNFNFAKVGIPAIDIAPGITQMDDSIFKYYHQAADNPDDIDYDYLLTFCKTFAKIARLIADKEDAIKWGDGKGWPRGDEQSKP